MEKFDEVISLGYNCEVSFRIEDFFGRINPMPFSWSYVLDRSRFPDVLRNSKALFSKGESLCEDRMIKCNLFELKFHPRYSILPQFGTYTEEQYQMAVGELKGRVEHLTDKFTELCNSEKHTLFVMKVEDYGNNDNVCYIKDVHSALKEVYRSQKFVLAVLMQKKCLTAEIKALESDTVKIFGLSKFAPKKHTNIMGDIRGWYKFFALITRTRKPGFFWNVYKRRWAWFWSTVEKKLKIFP